MSRIQRSSLLTSYSFAHWKHVSRCKNERTARFYHLSQELAVDYPSYWCSYLKRLVCLWLPLLLLSIHYFYRYVKCLLYLINRESWTYTEHYVRPFTIYVCQTTPYLTHAHCTHVICPCIAILWLLLYTQLDLDSKCARRYPRCMDKWPNSLC